MEKATEEAAANLQQEWGDDYKANTSYAARAAKEFGGDGFTEFVETAEIDGVKLGNHPAFLRAFADISRKMGKGRPLVEGDSEAAQTVQEEIDELYALQGQRHGEMQSRRDAEPYSGTLPKAPRQPADCGK